MEVREKALKAKSAAHDIGLLGQNEKNKILHAIANALLENTDSIIEANKIDLENAEKTGMKRSFIDRLTLNEKRIKGIADGIEDIAKLDDPIGKAEMFKRPNGLIIAKTVVPLGVIGIIFESRPNVSMDVMALCIKSGNACILRGGSAAINSVIALVDTAKKAAVKVGLPEDAVQVIEDTSRDSAKEMMSLSGIIDVLIPRGGKGLIDTVVKESKVPVIETGIGNCHTYVDYNANEKMALDIIVNAKVSRPSVCNALEKVLVHKDIANEFVPKCVKALRDNGVEVRGCEKVKAIVPDVIEATEEDWYEEYLSYIAAIKVVDDLEHAIKHINKYGSAHSDAIITENYENSQRFLAEVDSAVVYVNASTRFTDGYEFGFGGEIGISTQKLHARGPMGVKELTTVKYNIYGNGQIRV